MSDDEQRVWTIQFGVPDVPYSAAVVPWGVDYEEAMRGLKAFREAYLAAFTSFTPGAERPYSPPPPPPAPSQEPVGNVPMCTVHRVAMKPSQHGGWYCTRKVGDGFCNQKVAA